MKNTVTVLNFLGEGGSIEIIKVNEEDKSYFVLSTNESFWKDDKINSTQKVYPTFIRAFKELDKKYPWYYLHLESVVERYKEVINIKLAEHRKKTTFNHETYQHVEDQFIKILN